MACTVHNEWQLTRPFAAATRRLKMAETAIGGTDVVMVSERMTAMRAKYLGHLSSAEKSKAAMYHNVHLGCVARRLAGTTDG